MKLWKKLLCVCSVFAMCISMLTMPTVVHASTADEDAIIAELIMYYQNYQDAAQTDIDRLLKDLSDLNAEKAQAWTEIMNYWSEVNQENFTNTAGVPEGLPTDDSLAVVVLGLKLNSDGTMADELISRLQAGLDIANAYPNSYVVVTGGGTAANNPNVTEGGLMGEWMLEQGLAPERLIVENAAPDTVGNAKNTYAILAAEYPSVNSIALVTSWYHVPRGCLLYNSKFVLEAYEQKGEPLKIVANRGSETSNSGNESMASQGNGLRSVAGISDKPSVVLSELETLKVSQNTMYETGKDLDLTVTAMYTSGYERDVTELVAIEGFSKDADANQTITISYVEGEYSVTGTFALTESSKILVDPAKLATLIAKAEAIDPTIYTASSYAALETALYAAHEAYSNTDLTYEEMKEVVSELNFRIFTLRKPVNVIPYSKSVTANDGSTDLSKIMDGKTSTYWTSSDSIVGISDLFIDFELDGYYDLSQIVVRPYHSSNDAATRSYFYDVYVSEDGEEYIKVGEHTATGTTEEGTAFPLDLDFNVKYIRIDGTGKVNPGNQTNQKFHLSEVFAYGEEAGNIITGKKFTSTGADTSYASSSEATAEKAFDGDRSTYFDAGAYKSSPWIIVDLEDTYALSSVNVVNYYTKARYYKYDIYASLDGIRYVKIAEKSDESNSTVAGNTFTYDEPIYAKYLKLVGTYNSANSAFHLNEFRAYGRLATEDDLEGIQKQEVVQLKQELKDIVDSYIRSDFVASTWDEFVQTRDAVKARLAQEDMTAEEVAAMKAELELADDVLVKGNPDAKPEGTFRLASFNIWAPNPAHPNVEGINELLLRVDADYAGIQEVDRNNTRDNRDVIALIADDDYQSNYQKAIDYKSGEYGIGQLSSTEMLEKTGGSYTKVNNEEGRAWMRMLVEIDGKQVAIYNTHLSVGEDNAAANALNITELLALLDNDPVPYKLVTGDYNATKEKMDPIKENYNLANGQDGLWYSTFEGDQYAEGQGYLDGIPAENVISGIDNIIYSRNIELENFRVVHSNGLSDHYLIYGDFKLLAYEDDLQAYVNENTYTEYEVSAATWNAYKTAYDEAISLLANDDFEQLQDECKAALENLTAAVNALEFEDRTKLTLEAEATDYKTIQLNWESAMEVEEYIVERLSDEEWIEVVRTTEESYTAKGVKTGKEYTYRVKGIRNGVEFNISENVSVTPMLEGEIVLELAMNGTNKFDLSWNGVAGATRYIIYRKAGDGEWKKILTLGKDARSYTTKSTAAGTYKYQVKAARYDSSERVYGAESNEVVGVSVSESIVVAATEVDETSVTLSWNKVAGMKYYEVYRAAQADGTYRLAKRTTALETVCISLSSNKTYYFKVRAYNTIDQNKVYTAFSEVLTYKN